MRFPVVWKWKSREIKELAWGYIVSQQKGQDLNLVLSESHSEGQERWWSLVVNSGLGGSHRLFISSFLTCWLVLGTLDSLILGFIICKNNDHNICKVVVSFN